MYIFFRIFDLYLLVSQLQFPLRDRSLMDHPKLADLCFYNDASGCCWETFSNHSAWLMTMVGGITQDHPVIIVHAIAGSLNHEQSH